MTTSSLRHPHVSLEDTIAMKLNLLIDGVIARGGTHRTNVVLSREIVADITDLIRAEIKAALTPPPEPDPVIAETDLVKHLYRSGQRDWSLVLIHVPTGFKEDRNSMELGDNLEPRWKSQLQATADALTHLEGRVRAELARRAGD